MIPFFESFSQTNSKENLVASYTPLSEKINENSFGVDFKFSVSSNNPFTRMILSSTLNFLILVCTDSGC